MKVRAVVVAMIVSVVMAGCMCPGAVCSRAASCPIEAKAGASDFERVGHLLRQWERALETKDIDAGLTLYADSFNSREFGGDKDALAAWAKDQLAEGFFDDVEVDLAPLKTEMLPDRAAAYGIKVTGPNLGEASLCLGLGKFDGEWKIDGMDTE